MKRVAAACAMAAIMSVTGAVHANEKLAQASGCNTCHAPEKKLIGPSYKEMGAKYSSDKAAAGNLFKKVKAGGQGVWGPVPMPPNAHVKDDDVKTLVQWILTLK